MTDIPALRATRDREIVAASEKLGKHSDLRLSFWSFNNYKTCSQRYGLQVVRRDAALRRDDAFYSLNGSAVHGVWEDFIGGVRRGQLKWEDRDFLTDNAAEKYDSVREGRWVDWNSHGVSPEEHRLKAIPEIYDSVTYLHQSLIRDGLIPCDPSTVHAEVSFTTSLHPALTLTGRCDLVFEKPTEIVIRDLKDVWKKEKVDWRQLIWYVLGLEPQFGKPCTDVAFILTRLRDIVARKPDNKHPKSGLTFRNHLLREIIETAIKIRREPFRANVSRHHCTYCPVSYLCPEWTEYSESSTELLNTVSLLGEGTVQI